MILSDSPSNSKIKFFDTSTSSSVQFSFKQARQTTLTKHKSLFKQARTKSTFHTFPLQLLPCGLLVVPLWPPRGSLWCLVVPSWSPCGASVVSLWSLVAPFCATLQRTTPSTEQLIARHPKQRGGLCEAPGIRRALGAQGV